MHLHTQAGHEIDVTAEYIRNHEHTKWTKPWGEDLGMELHAMKPFNPISGTVYSGDNALRLYLPQLESLRMEPNYEIDLRYSTLNQLERHNCTVRAGAIGHTVIATISDDRTKWKKYTVYNYSDVIYIKNLYRYEDYRLRKFNWAEACKKMNIYEGLMDDAVRMIKNCGVRIMSARRMAGSYVSHENTVYVASPEDLETKERLFEAVFHELAHWTKDNLPGCRRTYGYAQEEIVAQQTMFMLMEHFGLGITEGMLDYLHSWLIPLTLDEARYVWADALESATTAYERLISFI